MPIYLREGSKCWQIDIVHGDKRIRRSSGTVDKQKAQELHDKLKHELWQVKELDKKPERSWDEACVRWLKEKAHKKSLNDDKAKIRALTQFRGKALSDLSRDYIMKTIGSLDCSNATKNRYISLVGAILRKCAGEWEWIDKSPALTRFKEPKKRIRWLHPEEAERLLQALPDVISDMAHFSLLTGLRQSNVLNLEWEQIDLDRGMAWIHPDQTKSGRPLGVPLNDSAVAILRAQKGRDKNYVFVRYGKKQNGIDSALWKKALNQAGISEFKWHDLRHTWASWLVQSGVPLMDLKELGGWETIEMVQRYAHLAPDHLKKHASHSDKIHVTNLSHYKKSAKIIPFVA